MNHSTRRRIDTARDLLVGKVPDPKSQVEQITIALIYKFMDDIDAESEEFGGTRTFFADDFARFGWAKLMHSGLGGHEILNLYADAITRMPENPGIPPLFRDIFKNAFLPYRDPETLRDFLKVIDEFTYDHSERLGDAFEYLLSVLGSQGDAGQFRTPRHIIDFIVAVIDPKKNDTILDPACGTAGFLISSYKHILKANTDADGHSTLTPDERGRLATNCQGYDISPDMVRLSLVNMYLHGFAAPHIFEYDTLTSQERWNEYADVILANPPFMSPKGGIRPHNRFSVQSKRSEVLFVDYIAEHLTSSGRAGIIVPEGIIFQSQTAYKQLRKLLVEDYLVAVVSLPAGVFQPYSGVKTSILILDKALAKKTDRIAFFKIENDGFDLGAQRRAIDKNDLPQVQKELGEYLGRLRAGEPGGDFQTVLGLVVEKAKVATGGEYNLSGERYRESGTLNTVYDLVPVGRFLRPNVKNVDPRKTPDEVFELWSIPAYDAGNPELLRGGDIGSSKKIVLPGDVLLSRIIPHIRRAWVVKEKPDKRRQVASTEWIVFSSREVTPEYLRHVLISDPFHSRFMQTITGVGGSLSRANPAAVADIQIPLPPLEVQKEIVAEIEGYQKVIDGARTVVENYRPHIVIDPEWPMVPLGDHFVTMSGGTPSKAEPNFWTGQIPWISPKDMKTDFIIETTDHISEEAVEGSTTKLIPSGSVICVVRSGILKHTLPLAMLTRPMCINQDIVAFKPKTDVISPQFLFYVLKTKASSILEKGIKPGVTVQSFYNGFFHDYSIPLPSIETQCAIVSKIEAEQALVNANRELIERFEKKIQGTIGRVWGESQLEFSTA